MTVPQRITELWAWVACDDGSGGEGVLGVIGPLGAMPAMGADRDRIESYRDMAAASAAAAGVRIELRRFTDCTVVDAVDP